MNNMFVLEDMTIMASFQKSINMVEHKFNFPLHKKSHNIVSREIRDIIFRELQWVENVGTESSIMDALLTVYHMLVNLNNLSVYMTLPLKSIIHSQFKRHEWPLLVG